jgi:hypothetical protein
VDFFSIWWVNGRQSIWSVSPVGIVQDTPGFVIFSGILAVVAFWTLYHFVSYILKQTTPGGILQRIENHLSPDYIIQQAE